LELVQGFNPKAAPKQNAPPDAEVELFRRGKEVLGVQAGGMIAKLLKAKDGKVALARAAIEQASTKHDAREYIGRVLRGADDGKDRPYSPIV
jgi:hypothetical protein